MLGVSQRGLGRGLAGRSLPGRLQKIPAHRFAHSLEAGIPDAGLPDAGKSARIALDMGVVVVDGAAHGLDAVGVVAAGALLGRFLVLARTAVLARWERGHPESYFPGLAVVAVGPAE